MGSLAISSPQKNRLSRGRFGRGRDTRNLFWCTLDRLKQPQNTALTFFFSLLYNVLVAQPLPRRKTTMSPLYRPFDPFSTFLVLDDFFGENEASAWRIVLHTQHTHTPSTVEHWNIQRYLFTSEFQWFGANSLLAKFEKAEVTEFLLTLITRKGGKGGNFLPCVIDTRSSSAFCRFHSFFGNIA